MQSLFLVGAVAFPFIAMPLLWRRMKRVQAQAYRWSEPQPHEQPWEARIGGQDGLTLGHANNPNDELIALGGKSRESRWPVDTQ